MNYAIEIDELTKSYKRIKAVDNLSIRVPEGKIYGFLGRNGAGKTTTIRMIMGLIKPDSGNIRVFGKDVNKDRSHAARKIGSIVETPGFYENLTARGNLEITAGLFGSNRSRIEEVLEIVGLTGCSKKKVGQFSLGMKQRLGIANALIHAPGILILDEPTNGLDPAGIKDMRNFLKRLSREHGITVMVSSHILSEVQLLADYAGIINEGRLIEEIEIQSMAGEGQSCLLLEVDNRKEAVRVLEEMQLAHIAEQGAIRVFCSRSDNAGINRNLVTRNISIYNSSSISQSLEERFLSKVGESGIVTAEAVKI